MADRRGFSNLPLIAGPPLKVNRFFPPVGPIITSDFNVIDYFCSNHADW